MPQIYTPVFKTYREWNSDQKREEYVYEKILNKNTCTKYQLNRKPKTYQQIRKEEPAGIKKKVVFYFLTTNYYNTSLLIRRLYWMFGSQICFILCYSI